MKMRLKVTFKGFNLYFRLTPDGCCRYIRFDYPVSQYTTNPNDVQYKLLYAGTTDQGIGYWVDENDPNKVLYKTGDVWKMGSSGLYGTSAHGEIYSPDTKCPPFEDTPNHSWSFSFPHTFDCVEPAVDGYVIKILTSFYVRKILQTNRRLT